MNRFTRWMTPLPVPTEMKISNTWKTIWSMKPKKEIAL